MALAPTFVKEVAMASLASMAPSPSPSHVLSSSGLQPNPPFPRALQSGSQRSPSFSRVTQNGSHPNPCFSRVTRSGPEPISPNFSRVFPGSHPRPCFCRVSQRSGSKPSPCFPRVSQNGSQANSCFPTGLQTSSSPPDPWISRVLRSGSRPNWRSEASKGFSCRAAAASSSPPQDCELPAKLQEIVRVFQGVTEPRAKCEALLKYAAKLKPLADEQKQPENKVEGCVSNVYIVCEVDGTGRVYFEAESDVLLTKGLAGLLVEGLSGVTVEEVLNLTPDFVHMLGLKQSLTPSRSNGFLNMLKLIQKKTLQLYSNSNPMLAATTTTTATLPITSIHPAPTPSTKHVIEKKLTEGLTPLQLEVQDVSDQHAGHAGAPRGGSSETHFHVKIVSEQFQGRSLLTRHRLVYDLLHTELHEGGVHALTLSTKTPSEVAPTS